MGRKRKKIIRVTRKLPKVYNCPNCGKASMRINRKPIKEEQLIIQPGMPKRTMYDVKVLCGDCNISKDYESRKEPIDLYNDFVDWFMKSGSI